MSVWLFSFCWGGGSTVFETMIWQSLVFRDFLSVYINFQFVHTLPKTNKAPKNGGFLFLQNFQGAPIFRCELLVLGIRVTFCNTLISHPQLVQIRCSKRHWPLRSFLLPRRPWQLGFFSCETPDGHAMNWYTRLYEFYMRIIGKVERVPRQQRSEWPQVIFIVYCLSVGAGKCLEKSLVVLRNNSVYSVSVPALLSKESNARSKTTGSLGNAKKMERKVRTLRVHRKSSNRLGKDFPAINWYRRNATIRGTCCIPAKIFNFARHKERNWRNSCEKPLPKRQEEHFEDFDFFVFEQITKKIDLFGEWNFRWNVQWESSKASLFLFTLTAWIFSLKFPWCLLARQEIKIILLAFDVRLFKCEEIQDGEALEDERKARHEKLAAAKVLPVERWCFVPPTFWCWAKLSCSFFFGIP